MKECLRCKQEHDGSYGTGRYCSKKCAFTRNENQLAALRRPKSEEAKMNMRKPKRDSSKMGKHDKTGEKNPNSIARNGKLKDRDGDQYKNICTANKKNGLGWSEENIKKHSERMLGETNWMRNKKHSDETKLKISISKKEQYEKGLVKINKNTISNGEISISNYLISKNIEFKNQFQIKNVSFIYDFYLPLYNIIIEYNGDFWHANPTIYNEDKILTDGKTAEEIWEKDKLKKQIAEENGYKFYTIWEKDYNPGYKNIYDNNIIQQIINENTFFGH